MAENKLVQFNFENCSYNLSRIVNKYHFDTLDQDNSWTHISLELLATVKSLVIRNDGSTFIYNIFAPQIKGSNCATKLMYLS